MSHAAVTSDFVRSGIHLISFFFFFNDTATTEIYTLSLHDALPISRTSGRALVTSWPARLIVPEVARTSPLRTPSRSEEHTSELQSHLNLVCRLLLEKKKKNTEIERCRSETRRTTQVGTLAPHRTD